MISKKAFSRGAPFAYSCGVSVRFEAISALIKTASPCSKLQCSSLLLLNQTYACCKSVPYLLKLLQLYDNVAHAHTLCELRQFYANDFFNLLKSPAPTVKCSVCSEQSWCLSMHHHNPYSDTMT